MTFFYCHISNQNAHFSLYDILIMFVVNKYIFFFIWKKHAHSMQKHDLWPLILKSQTTSRLQKCNWTKNLNYVKLVTRINLGSLIWTQLLIIRWQMDQVGHWHVARCSSWHLSTICHFPFIPPIHTRSYWWLSQQQNCSFWLLPVIQLLFGVHITRGNRLT